MKPAVSELHIPSDHPAFAGHFPGHPIVPGVLLLDRVLRALQTELALDPQTRWRIAQVKFHHSVGPGARLQLQFEPGAASLPFELRCEDRLIASGMLERLEHG